MATYRVVPVTVAGTRRWQVYRGGEPVGKAQFSKSHAIDEATDLAGEHDHVDVHDHEPIGVTG